MKALRIHTWRSAPRLEEIDMPTPSTREALVRIKAAGLSHFDLTMASGEFDIRPDLPYVPGVDGAGVVVQSETWAPGSRVAIRGGGIGIDRPGTWAEYVVVPDEALAEVRDELDLELAAVAYDPLTTAFVTLNGVGGLGSWTSAGVNAAQDEIVLVTGRPAQWGPPSSSWPRAPVHGSSVSYRTPGEWNSSRPWPRSFEPTTPRLSQTSRANAVSRSSSTPSEEWVWPAVLLGSGLAVALPWWVHRGHRGRSRPAELADGRCLSAAGQHAVAQWRGRCRSGRASRPVG